MISQLTKIKDETLTALAEVETIKELEDLRVKVLGKKGALTAILKEMGNLPKDERPKAGQIANETRETVENKIEEIKTRLAENQLETRLKKESIDVTIPGKRRPLGRFHPMTSAMEEIKKIFIGMGYSIEEGPDVELDYYNFEALNIPKGHPARDEQDTFYVEGGPVLRTQTSPVQIRAMEKRRPPIKIIAPGRVFRSDAVDATHSPVFHQIEGLAVDKGVTMGDLKGALTVFAKELFGEEIKTRFRPHHFPFTEPSAEMDVTCFACGGSGCRVCKNSGWIELLGCGMAHPAVLKNCGIDPEIYSGFAFGMGLERSAMARYGILDMRLMYENDVNFLNQF
jgi:phenylalanyl-tRNA synthetase alpha chain